MEGDRLRLFSFASSSSSSDVDAGFVNTFLLNESRPGESISLSICFFASVMNSE